VDFGVCVCIYSAERPLQPTEDRTQNTGASTISQKSLIFFILRGKISGMLIFENCQLSDGCKQSYSQAQQLQISQKSAPQWLYIAISRAR